MKLKQRIYGIAGIQSIMSNWNADMSGFPKSTSDGNIFGSCHALKYPIKRMWDSQGETVLNLKSYKIGDKEPLLQPLTLKERYEALFNRGVTDKTPSQEILQNLFTAIDVMNFGSTFAEKKHNYSITGAVQIGQGFNKYEDACIEAMDVMSPFKNSNPNSEKNTATTLGRKYITNEAHYFYPFSVNPNSYDEYSEIIPNFEGYTVEAYEKFKQALLIAPTAFNTCSKVGCENEFGLFVVCKEDSNLYLPCLDTYLQFAKKDNKSVIDISILADRLNNHMEDIDSIEVYYNPLTTELITGDLPCEIKSLI